MTWQEAAVSSELSPAGKAPLEGWPTRISVALWAQWGAPRPQWATEGACLPLSKHRGMTWLFDSGTGGLGQIPVSRGAFVRACMCVCACSRVRVCERIFTGARRNQDKGSLGSLQMATNGKHSPAWLLNAWGDGLPPLRPGRLPAEETWPLPLLDPGAWAEGRRPVCCPRVSGCGKGS